MPEVLEWKPSLIPWKIAAEAETGDSGLYSVTTTGLLTLELLAMGGRVKQAIGIGQYETLDEAKAAAQRDHQERKARAEA